MLCVIHVDDTNSPELRTRRAECGTASEADQ
jgi:hypothetical protein